MKYVFDDTIVNIQISEAGILQTMEVIMNLI